jgi:hypothetical protein
MSNLRGGRFLFRRGYWHLWRGFRRLLGLGLGLGSLRSGRRKVGVVAHRERLDILLFLDINDHLLKIVRRNMSFPASTPAAHGVLSVYSRM